MNPFLGLALLAGAGSCFLLTRVLWVPSAYQIEVPFNGMLRRVRQSLTEKEPSYPVLLSILRVFAHHVEPHLRRQGTVKVLAWLEETLPRSGYTLGLTALEHLSLAVFVFVSAFLLGTAASWWSSGLPNPAVSFPIAVLAASLPFLSIVDRANRRLKSINGALPYVLDLMTLSLDAGLDFIQALDRTIRNRPAGDALREELEFVLHEISMGKTRRDALLSLKDRVRSAYVGDVVVGIIQSEELGSPLVKTLRIYSASIRLKRMQRAEKLAAEAPVKMIFPMLLIVLAVILTIFGPFIVLGMRGEFFG